MPTLKNIVNNPYLNIVVGLVLLYSGMSETIQELKELDEFRLGAHHGITLFALLHTLKTLPEIFDALERFNSAK